jgi:predicted nucleic acid binding AN1-type Zn finger protein
LPCPSAKKPCNLQDRKKTSKKKHWKPLENMRYVAFLSENKELFEKDREDKRILKINILMSKYVKSKNSTQCRSHHQKMLVHYKNIDNIILYLCSQPEEEIQIQEEEDVQNSEVLQSVETEDSTGTT